MRKVQRYGQLLRMPSSEASLRCTSCSFATNQFDPDRYLQLLKSTREAGFRGQQQNYVPGVDGPAGGPEVLTAYPTAQEAKGSRGSDTRPGNTTGKGGATLY